MKMLLRKIERIGNAKLNENSDKKRKIDREYMKKK